MGPKSSVTMALLWGKSKQQGKTPSCGRVDIRENQAMRANITFTTRLGVRHEIIFAWALLSHGKYEDSYLKD